MNTSRLHRLLRLLSLTEEEELSCAQCFELLPRYVELNVAGGAPDAGLPLFEQHLQQCAVCREEYDTLRELVRLEAQEHPPSGEDVRRSF
jgi:hypothetical protein